MRIILSNYFFRDILSENRKISDEGESIMPDKQYQIDADTRKFEFSMQKIDNKERCIKFYTAHMEVRVYADNCLIYTIDSPKPFYEKHREQSGILLKYRQIQKSYCNTTGCLSGSQTEGYKFLHWEFGADVQQDPIWFRIGYCCEPH